MKNVESKIEFIWNVGVCLVSRKPAENSRVRFLPAWIRKFLGSMLLALFSTMAAAGPMILQRGEVRVLPIDHVERVAVGSPDIVNYKILENGELVLIAASPGDTELHIWREGNRQSQFTVRVYAGNVSDQAIFARRLLQGIPGVTVSAVRDRVIFEGTISQRDAKTVKEVAKNIGNVTNLTRIRDFDVEKMIRMDVRIMEVGKSDLQQLGIKWNETIAGPAAAIHTNIIPNHGGTGADGQPFNFGVRSKDPNDISGNFDEIMDRADPADSNFYGYMGLTSTISSQIDLLAEAGDAHSIASPKLIARSGEKASFHAGGQFPIPVVSQFGVPSVDFQDYGIKLNIKPTAFGDQIKTEVYAEVSSIDFSTAVNGVPGILTRNADTVINVKDGDTLVISGLASMADSQSVNKVPVLGDIPFLGALFRSKGTRQQNTELLIVVTPHVVSSGDQYDGQLQGVAEKWMKHYRDTGAVQPALLE